MAPRLPRRVGGYELREVLGRGGMGEVYRAEHEMLARPVAVKRLMVPDGVADDERAAWRERFLREGRALASLHHESIPQVHDLFEHRGDLYMAQELVDGFTLHDVCRRGALPVDVACIVGLAVARALEAAHAKGIVHRDVKPANVMLSKDGVVKLMDFGIAKDPGDEKLTATGQVVGTPNYLAPEVLSGHAADERSDVYALGAMLYECLSGRRLFQHASPESFFALILAGKFPPLAKVAPGLPRALRKIVERSLAVKADRRWRTAAALAAELDLFLLAHHTASSHRTRLVSFLTAAGKLTEAEALTAIDASDLVVAEEVPLVRRRQPWRAVAVAALVAALASTAALGLATGALQRAVDAAREARGEAPP